MKTAEARAYAQQQIEQLDIVSAFVKGIDTVAMHIEKACDFMTKKDVEQTYLSMQTAHELLNSLTVSIFDAAEEGNPLCKPLYTYFQRIYTQLVRCQLHYDTALGKRIVQSLRRTSKQFKEVQKREKERGANSSAISDAQESQPNPYLQQETINQVTQESLNFSA